MNYPLDLLLPANDGVQFPFPSQLGIVLAILIQGGGFPPSCGLGPGAAGARIASPWGDAATALGQVAAGPATYSSVLLIYLLPHSVLMVPIITALFPRLSAAAARGDLAGVRADLSTGLRLAAVVTVFATTVVVVLAGPLLKAVLPTASVEMIEVAIPVLQAMAPGLVALGATILVKRMYFALGDGRSVFVIQVLATSISVLVVLVATWVLDFRWWTVAAAAAGSLAAWVSVLARVRGMRRKLGGIAGHRVLRVYVRTGLASLVAGAAGLALMRLVDAPAALTWVQAVAVTAGIGLVMVGVYLAGLRLMRVRELESALGPLLRRLRRTR